MRSDIYVVGIGNPLREDDQVGLHLIERLEGHFTGGFHGIKLYEPDIALAETIAGVPNLLIIDALAAEKELPYRMIELAPADNFCPTGGFSSHVFDWPMLLSMARDLFGSAPRTFLCGVRAHRFGISEQLSQECQADADAAFSYLCAYLGLTGC
jgi:hydrogenase maturation protease